jgi:hypothetical protein
VSNIVIRVCVDKLARFRIGVNWGKAEILDVIWSANLIEQYIPVRPSHRTTVEIIE